MMWWLALLACTGEVPEPAKTEPVAEVAKAAQKAADQAKAGAALPDLKLKDLQDKAAVPALVPSPVETQRALEKSGIETKLNTLIPTREMKMSNSDPDHAAVRTGVVLADLLLTVKSASDEELLARVAGIQTGMKQLNGGDDIDMTLTDVAERIKAKAVTRDELLQEFDELSAVVIPELKFNGQERIVPLIEAGSWLEGSNLVARALKDAKEKGAAESMLKAPAVVDHFLKYVRNEGSTKAPEVVTKQLESSLLELKAVAQKKDALVDADIDKVITVTNDVLTLL